MGLLGPVSICIVDADGPHLCIRKPHFVTDTTFKDLGLTEVLTTALAAKNYTQPTPIQARAIPLQLEGRDVLGIAQTGTGKTAAFALPILHHLATQPTKVRPKSVRALILAPTRELAIQIGDGLRDYAKNMRLRQAVIFGGVGYKPQIDRLSRGVHTLVATPGRLIDLLNQGHVHLDDVEHFVLDEADRMLDMGFIHDVKRILKLLPEERQSLLFSATMPQAVAHLADEILNQPQRVEVTPKVVAIDRIDQRVFFVDTKEKRDLLSRLLADESMERVIVFTRTKHGANRAAEQLAKKGIRAEAIHGNKSQGARQAALRGFKQGQVRVLVATDIASRGIDVDNVTHVINFDLPNEPESYVHRIGRTARAGRTGIAISFCDASEVDYLKDIEKLTKHAIEVAGGERPSADVVKLARKAVKQRRQEGQQKRSKPKFAGKPGQNKGAQKTGQKSGFKANSNKRRSGGGRNRRTAA